MKSDDLITVYPDILGGTPVFRGTRVPVKTFFDYLEFGSWDFSGCWILALGCFLCVLQNVLHPLLIIQIPAHRLTNALLELVGGHPAELTFNLGSIDRIPAVVAGAIFDKGDELARTAS